MAVKINILAVALAAFTTMAVGYWWYLPKVFGNTWIKLANIDVDRLNSRLAMGSAGVSLVIMAFALAYLAYIFNGFFKHSFLVDTLIAGIFVWLSFQALRIFQLAEFNQRSHLETAIHVGNELLTIMVMAFIIGLMGIG